MTPSRLLRTALPVIVALGLGWWARSAWLPDGSGSAGRTTDASSARCEGGAAPIYWRAPMDPAYVRDAPGKSPMGMDLVPVCPSGEAESETVRIDPSTQHNIGVRTATAVTRDLSRSVRAAARIATDERRVAHIHTKVQGWVEELMVDYVGQQVATGDPLLRIYSPELVATQEELLLAARYRSVTAESPFADVNEGGKALFAATRRRLALWDIADRDVERLLETGQIQKTLTLYAPSRGVVTRLGVRTGMEVTPNANLYTIADLSHVWVIAEVYEFELPWIGVGQHGVVELASLPGMQFSGEVTYVAPFLDPATRTAQVRLELPNPEGLLKPEMFGNVLIDGGARTAVVAVPSEAVIRSGRRTLVMVALGDGRFDPREVALGVESGDGLVEIAGGLEAGEEIVVSGQFLIDGESRLQADVGKLRSDPGEPAAAGSLDR